MPKRPETSPGDHQLTTILVAVSAKDKTVPARGDRGIVRRSILRRTKLCRSQMIVRYARSKGSIPPFSLYTSIEDSQRKRREDLKAGVRIWSSEKRLHGSV